MDELEKSESVLGNLYALRGGLSAISVERDKARNADTECYEKLKAVAKQAELEHDEKEKDGDVSLKYCEWLCGNEPERLLEEKHTKTLADLKREEDGILYGIKEKQIEDRTYKIKTSRAEWEGDAKKYFKIMWWCLGSFLVVTIAATLLSLFVTLSIGIFLAYIIIPLFITSMVYLGRGISAKKTVKWCEKELVEHKKALQEQRAAEAARVARERAVVYEKYKDKRNNIEESYSKLIKKLSEAREETRRLLNERNAQIKPLAESCDVYYKALTAQFTPLLDERDWQHLDLVIYQLETRRADSIKEALQLVDRELQTERLENSIITATKSICYTLQCGFTALAYSVQLCCDRISARIDSLSDEIVAQSMRVADSVNRNTGSLKSQLADLTDSVNVGNALQAKANESSTQLVKDVYALRYYVTDTYA